ncbi:MAG: glycosyltransferase family 4 protein [Terriglobales bacterium]
MRIALIAPPFISVPPTVYGGTELFIAHLAVGLKQLGHDVVVYANGESTVPVALKSLYPTSEWPIQGEVHGSLKDFNHSAWAIADAHASCDLLHLNNAPGLVYSRFVSTPFVYTIHHPQEPALSNFYGYYPEVTYVTISDFQRFRETMPRINTIHHGLDFSKYRLATEKQPYLAFIGRIAPVKGTHLAIQIAKQAGIPLKIAGEIQPLNQSYFEAEVKPHLDGDFIQYIGEADLEAKNELLGNALAMLFPIQWDEPFGLVMIEAMACGTPVIAMPGGSVPEIVKHGISGFVGRDVEEMAKYACRAPQFDPAQVRAYAEREFSIERMVRQYADVYERALAGVPVAPEKKIPQRAIA